MIAFDDGTVTIHEGEVRAILAELEAESVDAVMTSPPYWSLRDYGLEPVVWGGDPEHDHAWGDAIPVPNEATKGTDRWQHRTNGEGREYEIPADYRDRSPTQGQLCRCGAWRGQLGLEPSHHLYVEHIVEVMDAVWRVLKPEGTLWLNLGDTYAAKGRGSDVGWERSRLRNPGYVQKSQAASLRVDGRHRGKAAGLKEKDRAGIPHRVVLALQDAGWYWRDEIVWAKPNPMPSSTDDRTTPAHEFLFVLSKRPRYYWNGPAIAEAAVTADEIRWDPDTNGLGGGDRKTGRSTRRFKRPAGWNDGPTEDDTVGRYSGRTDGRWPGIGGKTAGKRLARGRDQQEGMTARVTRNRRSVWTIATQPYRSIHYATFPERLVEPVVRVAVPPGGVILDPFGGSGTVGQVARREGRRATLIEQNPAYVRDAIVRVTDRGVDPFTEDTATYPEGSLWRPA